MIEVFCRFCCVFTFHMRPVYCSLLLMLVWYAFSAFDHLAVDLTRSGHKLN